MARRRRSSDQRIRARATWISNDVYWNAILRNTISLTGLQGSNKTNVIPRGSDRPRSTSGCFPIRTRSSFCTLKRIVDDTAVHFTQQLEPKTPLESPIDTDLFRAIESAAHERDPGTHRVTTPMLTAATDRPTYRKLGIITYGFDPFMVENAEMHSGMHGNDERLSVANVGFGVHFLYDVLRRTRAVRATPIAARARDRVVPRGSRESTPRSCRRT